MEFGHTVRTTHSTTSNDTSSRSHAVCTIQLIDKEYYERGKIILVDLAVISFIFSSNKYILKGSERA